MDSTRLPTTSSYVRLDPYSAGPGFAGIVDADALLASVDNQCKTGWQSKLSQLGESSITPLLCSDHVYLECYRGLHRLAAHRQVDVSLLKHCFDTSYLPNITWVKVGAGEIRDERVSAVTDETDVPTARLASLVAPCVVFSNDKSLRRPGFASKEWLKAAGSGVEIVETHAKQQALGMTVVYPFHGALRGSLILGKKVGLPSWATAAILVGGGSLLLWPAQRRQALARILKPVADYLLDELIGQMEQMSAATATVHKVMLQPTLPRSSKQGIAAVLARASEPMLASAICELLADTIGGDSLPSPTEVRIILREHPEFVQVERYRWRLGVSREAMTWDRFMALGKKSGAIHE